MKVLIATMVFPPEPMVDAQTSSQLAEELVRSGHSVQVLAPYPNRPLGKVSSGYSRRLYATSTRSPGFSLTHCFGTLSPDSTMLNRLFENMSFGITSGLKLLLIERPDIIYSNTWPIFATGIIATIARLRNIPLVIIVQDIYPESLAAQKRVTEQEWIYRILLIVDRKISHLASEIILISEGFRRVYRDDRGIDAARLHIVQNWNDESLFDPDALAASEFRRKLAIPEHVFLAVYAGNIGVASNADILIEVFVALKEWPCLHLVIAGEGARLEACRERLQTECLEQVMIYSPWKTEETGRLLQMADVLLLPTKGTQSLASVPSKMIGYLLSARPVIAAVMPESDTAATILKSGGGWVVQPDSPELLAQAIVFASKLPKDKLKEMGRAGREYAMKHLTRASNLPRVINILEGASGLTNDEKINVCGATH